MYWMNKMCGCWTPIRDAHKREREVNGPKNGIDYAAYENQAGYIFGVSYSVVITRSKATTLWKGRYLS